MASQIILALLILSTGSSRILLNCTSTILTAIQAQVTLGVRAAVSSNYISSACMVNTPRFSATLVVCVAVFTRKSVFLIRGLVSCAGDILADYDWNITISLIFFTDG